MNPLKKPNISWVLCPSKRFPGKFYYFNVATGETTWCFNETEKTSSKHPLQNVDHSYPEPNTPPVKDTPPRQFPYTPYHANSFQNYHSDPNLQKNITVGSFKAPFESNYPKTVKAYKFELPILWECPQNMPEMVMSFNPTENQSFAQETQLIEQKEIDRHILVHTGKVPLSQRFINYESPVLKFKNNKIVDSQISQTCDKSPTDSYIPKLPFNESPVRNLGLKISTQNAKYQTEILNKPVFNLTKTQIKNCDTSYNPTKVNLESENIDINGNKLLSSNPFFGNINRQNQNLIVQNQSQNTKELFKPSQTYQLHKQTQTSQNLFEESLIGNKVFRQNQTMPGLFEKSKTDQDMFDQYKYQNLFDESQSQRGNIRQSFIRPGPLHQSQNEQDHFDQMNKGLFRHCQNKNQGLTDKIKLNEANSRQSQSKMQRQFDQSPTKQNLFDDNQLNKGLFSQNKKQGLSEQIQTDQDQLDQNQIKSDDKYLFRQSLTKKKGIFDQHQSNKGLFNQYRKHGLFDQNYFHESAPEQEHFDHSQNEQDLNDQSQTCFSNLQTDYEINCFQKRVAEKSALKQSCMDEFPAKPVIEAPTGFQDMTAKGNSNLSQEDKVQNEDLLDLDENDLRRFLLTKKRKSYDLSSTADNMKDKKIKTKEQTEIAVPKKKVTFNPVLDIFSDSLDIEDGPNDDLVCDKSSHEDSGGKEWYVVADTITLLEEYYMIDSFVKSDPACSLVIPHRVMSDTVALSRRECPERGLVTRARHLLRTLDTPPPHVIMQTSDKEVSSNTLTNVSILNCCLEIMENARVVLITNDNDLRSKAECIGIDCYNTQQIKNIQKRPTLNFDIKKIKISIPNEQENLEVPAKNEQSLTFGDFENSTINQNGLASNCFDCVFNQNFGTKTNSIYSLNEDFRNSKTNEDRESFQIQKDMASDVLKMSNEDRGSFETQKDVASSVLTLNTTSKNIFGIPKSNKNTSSYFLNNVIIKRTIDSENKSKTVQTDKRNENIASIFKQANENLQPVSKKGSIFEIETSKPRETSSSFGNIFKTNNDKDKAQSSRSIFENNVGNENQAQASIFGKGNHQEDLQPSILEKQQKKETQRKCSNFEKGSTTGIEIGLEEFLKSFSMKNRDIEHLTEQKKDEIICSFRQIMDECLLHLLLDKKNLLKKLHCLTPPFSFKESLQCVGLVYGHHKNVNDVVNVLSSVLNAKGEVPHSEVVRSFGCGMALVKCLQNVTDSTEHLVETEASLAAVLEQARVPHADFEPSAPLPSNTNSDGNERGRKNFVKDRSEVLQYLKKHYTGWADYDETLSENKPASWGKSFKDSMVVRICGKNLSKLTLNNSKPMTINETDSSRNDDKTALPPLKDKESSNLKILKMSQSLDPRIYSKENSAKNPNDEKSKLIVAVNITETQKTSLGEETNKHDKNIVSNENQNTETKFTEPKVVRLFSNYNFNKDPKEAKDRTGKHILDDFETRGHTFGSFDNNGPKVLRNIKPIKEFEEKIKFERKPLNLDEQDHSTMSLCVNNNDYDRYINDNQMTNDHSDVTNDTTPTNNKSYSMSLDNCIETNNNVYDTENMEEIRQTNMIGSKNDMFNSKNDIFNATSNIINGTNDVSNLDLISFGTSDFDNFFGITHDFVIQNMDGYNISEQKNDMIGQKNDTSAQKDDMTSDSGYENASQQAYCLVDTFLFELKVSFKLIHKFIAGSIRCLRAGGLCEAQRASVRAAAAATQAHLYAIVGKLDRIMYRETMTGPKVKELFKGNTTADEDVRIQNYRQIVKKCVKQVLIINNALKMLLQLTAAHTR